MSLLQTLKQPFPYERSPRRRVGMAAFFGAFVAVFLLVFRPFDLDFFPFQRLLLIAGGYGLITFLCVLIATLIFPFCLPGQFSESRWTTWKHIVFTAGVICFVGLMNYLLSPLLVNSNLSLYNAIWFQGITLAIAVLPISIYILLRQNRLLRKFSDQAQEIEKKLSEKKSVVIESQPSNKITLWGDYQNEKVEVYVDDLHLVASASNYIKVFHLQKDNLVYSIIRSTLKKAEEALLEHPNFFKCHRAYIINLDKVEHVEGNAQGYKLKITGHDELVPVSRNLNAEFSDKLLAFRKQPE
jgi:hypothetical protein